MCKDLEAGDWKGNSVFINNKNLSLFGTLWGKAEVRLLMSVGSKYEKLGFYAKELVPYYLESGETFKGFKQRIAWSVLSFREIILVARVREVLQVVWPAQRKFQQCEDPKGLTWDSCAGNSSSSVSPRPCRVRTYRKFVLRVTGVKPGRGAGRGQERREWIRGGGSVHEQEAWWLW